MTKAAWKPTRGAHASARAANLATTAADATVRIPRAAEETRISAPQELPAAGHCNPPHEGNLPDRPRRHSIPSGAHIRGASCKCGFMRESLALARGGGTLELHTKQTGGRVGQTGGQAGQTAVKTGKKGDMTMDMPHKMTWTCVKCGVRPLSNRYSNEVMQALRSRGGPIWERSLPNEGGGGRRYHSLKASQIRKLQPSPVRSPVVVAEIRTGGSLIGQVHSGYPSGPQSHTGKETMEVWRPNAAKQQPTTEA